jgi:hypothetical protein
VISSRAGREVDLLQPRSVLLNPLSEIHRGRRQNV